MKLQNLDFRVWSKLEICIEHLITATFAKLEAGGIYLGSEALENPKVKTLVEKSYRILDDKLNTILQKIEGKD